MPEVASIVENERDADVVIELERLLAQALAGDLTGIVAVVRLRGGSNESVSVGLIDRPRAVAYAERIKRRAMDDWVEG